MAKATSKKEVVQTAEPAVAVEHIPLIALHNSLTNPRKTYPERELAELAESIRAQGIINPITVRPFYESNKITAYEVVAGNRRYRAALLAELQLVPCIVRDLTDDQVMDIQIAENLHRQDVPPLEEAAAFQAMLDTRKIDVDELAGKIGKSARYVYRRLKLNNLHEKYIPFMESGDLAASTAEVLASYPQEAQLAIFKKTYYDWGGEIKFDTLQRIKGFLEQETCKELKRAIFPIDKENMQPGLVACTRCPKNTAVATLLFPDGESKPQCTDKACWKVKEAVHIALSVSEWEAYCKANGIEPHYYDLYYFQSDDKKNIEKVTGREIEPLRAYDYERVEDERDGAIEVMFVGGSTWGDDPNLSYTRGWVIKKQRGSGGGDYEIRQIKQDKTLTEEEKVQAIEQLITARKMREQAQKERARLKRWKERMVSHVIQHTAITGQTSALLRTWVKRIDEGDINGWWKYIFGTLLLDWRPESFPVNQDILEDHKEWDIQTKALWQDIIRTADGERDRNVWAHWLDDEEKQAFISNVADTATDNELIGIQARIMMIEIYQAEKSCNGTDIGVQDYAPLLGAASPEDFEAEPVEDETTDELDDDEDGDWDANEDE